MSLHNLTDNEIDNNEFIVIIVVTLISLCLLIINTRINSFNVNGIYNGWWEDLKKTSHKKIVIPPYCENYTFRKKKQSTFSNVARSIPGISNTVKPEKDFFESDLYYFDSKLFPQHDFTPVLCFVNSESGGNQGKLVMSCLKTLLNPIQIFDLKKKNADPYKALLKFRCFLPNLRILVCGGDGTVSWILSIIDKIKEDTTLDFFHRPPVAVLPLGTGNDLSRCLGWGSTTYANITDIKNILDDISWRCNIEVLDRWILSLTNGNDDTKEQKKTFVFQNYFGIGVDAEVVSKFHENREREKNKRSSSQIRNIILYGLFGAQEIMARHHADIHKVIELLDNEGRVIPIPEGAEGLIFSNISSFAGGSQLWYDELQCQNISKDGQGEVGDEDSISSPRLMREDNDNDDFHDVFSRSSGSLSPWSSASSQDGLLEVVAVTGALHLAQIKAGIASSIKLAQSSSFEIRLSKSLPIEFDGEPMRTQSNASVLTISKGKSAVMLRRSLNVKDDACRSAESDEVFMECLDFAVQKNYLTSQNQDELIEEYSKRLERRSQRKNKVLQWDINE